MEDDGDEQDEELLPTSQGINEDIQMIATPEIPSRSTEGSRKMNNKLTRLAQGNIVVNN